MCRIEICLGSSSHHNQPDFERPGPVDVPYFLGENFDDNFEWSNNHF